MSILRTNSLSITAWRLGALFALTLAALALLPAVALAQTPPAAPSAVTITRDNGTVTATWPAVPNADEYHITYTSDNGKSWTAAASPGDNYSQNSVTINNADNGKPYIVGVRAGNAHGWSDWRNSPSIAPLTPPATPGSITVTRADGSLTASWDAVDGADRYHVTYSSTNQESWTAAPCDTNCPDTSITFNASNTKTYFVGVRAGNAYGWSGWRNSSPSAPYSTPPQPPPAVAAVHVTRVCDHILNTSWPLSSGATGYDLNYSDDNRKSWARILTDASHNAWKLYNWSKNTTYRFAVRARNGGGTSDWTESAAAPPPPCKVGNLRATTSAVHGQAGGSITATWDAGKRASAYNVNHRRDGGEWERVKSNHSATSHTWSVTQSGSYLVAVQSVKDGGLSEWQNADVAWLTADGIAGTAAALTIAGHSGNWYYKANAAPDNTCKGPVSATTQNLTGLSVSNSYTYTAYTDSSCANAIGSTTFTTPAGISVSNLSETSDGTGSPISNTQTRASGFTTGANGGGYTLHNITAKFHGYVGSDPDDLTVAIHAADTDGNPAASATHALSVNNPSGAGDYTFTCTGACILDPSTTYFVFMSTTKSYGESGYLWDTTASTSQTNTPSNAGWTIADAEKSKQGEGNWQTNAGWIGMFRVAATTNSTVSVSNLSETSDGVGSPISNTQTRASGFTTGANGGGYTLHNITAKFHGYVGSDPDDLTVAIHAADTDGNPAASATHALSVNNPSGAGDYTFTCTGACILDPSTTYFVFMSTTKSYGESGYLWDTTASTSQTNTPSNAGWTIADAEKSKQGEGNWQTNAGWIGMFQVSATMNP